MTTPISRLSCFAILLSSLNQFSTASELTSSSPLLKAVSVVLPSSIPPYALKGELTGIIPQLLKLTFKRMNYQPNFTFLPNKRLVKSFRNNTFEAAFSVPQPYASNRIYYSNKIFDFSNIAVTLKSNKLKIDTINDLAFKRVAAFQNATEFLGFEFNEAIEDSRFYTEFNDQQEQIQLLIKKRADVIVLEKRIFNYFLKRLNTDDKLEDIFEIHDIFPSSPRYIAFHSTAMRLQFNKALAEVKKSDTYTRLLAVD